MARGLGLVALALAWPSAASGQFLSSFGFEFSAERVGGGRASSFSSSSSRGPDGQMHQEVQQDSSEDVGTRGGAVHSEKHLRCRDGHCKEQISRTSARRSSSLPPSCLQAALALLGLHRGPAVVTSGHPAAEPRSPPVLVITDLPPPSLRGFAGGRGRDRLPGGRASPLPPPTTRSEGAGSRGWDRFAGSRASTHPPMTRILTTGVIGLLFALVCEILARSRQLSELEGPLAEPLASADAGAPPEAEGRAVREAAKIAQRPDVVASQVAQDYLQGLYVKAQSGAERLAMGQYLASVYDRAVV